LAHELLTGESSPLFVVNAAETVMERVARSVDGHVRPREIR
jgi:hypothetical protein